MLLWSTIVILIAGGIGGIVNAILTDNGFVLPFVEKVNGVRIIRPGYVGNVLIGSVASIISWGLYGPLASANLFDSQETSLTLSTVTGAILIGITGAKWLTNEVDKTLLRAAVNEAAKAKPCLDSTQQILMASPAQVLSITKKLGLSSSRFEKYNDDLLVRDK